MPSSTHAVTAVLDDDVLVVNRVIGVLRRRNLALSGLGVGPAQPGALRLSFFVDTDEANAERVLRQIEKAHGVREVAVIPADAAVAREVVLARVRAGPADRAAVRATVADHHARIVDEGPDTLLVEGAGERAAMTQLVEALERFGVLELARSCVLLPRRAAGAARTHTQPSEAVL